MFRLGSIAIGCQRTPHRALGRVRTHLPADAGERPVFSVTRNWALSRLRRYRSGNCTFVTFWGQGNQQIGERRLPVITPFGVTLNGVKGKLRRPLIRMTAGSAQNDTQNCLCSSLQVRGSFPAVAVYERRMTRRSRCRRFCAKLLRAQGANGWQ